MNRRTFIGTVSALNLLAAVPAGRVAAQEDPPFGRATVIERARALAATAYVPPEPRVPGSLLDLSFTQYRQISAREEARLFVEPSTGFAVELLHSGFIYRDPVEIFVVREDQAARVVFDPERFDYPQIEGLPPQDPLEFAGFRGLTPLNAPDRMEPFVVFAGASYFRAIARGQVFGLSARGLAINTGEATGEEFPLFRAFWLEQPAGDRLVVHALLDSPSVTGAYRFTIRPGDQTLMDVETNLFARAAIDHLGLAPLTSMYLYDVKERGAFDDVRPAVHDSDGLAIWNGKDEHIWRPLHNPRLLQISAFADMGPLGFGLIQREKRSSEYEDLDALYHRRPSLWVEPIGDWGPGSVVLVEIPNTREINDNVVAFWRPEAPFAAGSEMTLTYRLTWGWDAPVGGGLLRVTRTLAGQGRDAARRRFAIDFSDPGGRAPAPVDEVEANVRASAGTIQNLSVRPNPDIAGLRVTFELDPEGNDGVDLRVDLTHQGGPMAEVWVYRWTG